MKRLMTFLTLATCMGCSDFFEQEVHVDLPDHESKLVLHSFINDEDSVVRIAVTKSIDIEKDGSTGERLKDVSINLLKNGEKVDDLMLDANSGHFISYDLPHAGDEYDIEVAVPSFETVTTNTKIPERGSLVDAEYGGVRYDIEGWKYEAIKIKFRDDPDHKNYYSVEVVSSTYTEEWRKNEDGSDTTYRYRGYDSFYLYSAPNNIIHTSYGSFFDDAGMSGESEIEVWIDEWNLPSPEEAETTWEYRNEFNEVVQKGKRIQTLYVKLKTVSESYFEYKTTLESHIWNQYPDLFSGEPIPMYSNVENGYGVFSAYTSDTISISPK